MFDHLLLIHKVVLAVAFSRNKHVQTVTKTILIFGFWLFKKMNSLIRNEQIVANLEAMI